jgi:hypothetical protein
MYSYHANALGVAGHIIRPQQELIQSQASVSLASIGGRAVSRVKPFRIDGILAFKEAYSEVAGSFDENHNVYTTSAYSTIENLNIADIVTADRLVCRTAAYAANSDSVPPEISVDITGSHFENLKIAGHKVDIELAAHVFHDHDTYSKIAKAFQIAELDSWIIGSKLAYLKDSEVEELEQTYCGLRGIHNFLYECKSKKERPYDRGSYWLSPANHLDLEKQIGPSEILSFGSIVCIPKLGCIFLAELLVESSIRRMNMLRVEFGSTHRGSLVASAVEIGGKAYSFSRTRLTPWASPMVPTTQQQPLRKDDAPDTRQEQNLIAMDLVRAVEDELLRAQSVRADWSTLNSSDQNLEGVIEEVASALDTFLSDPLLKAASIDQVKQVITSSRAKIGQSRLRLLKEAYRLNVPEQSRKQRVVNLAFLGKRGVIRPSEALEPNKRYDLRVQIGTLLAESIVQNPAKIPDVQLAQFMRPEGIPLRIVLSSRDFVLIDEELELTLPPIGPSQTVQFRMRTPVNTGVAQLRIVIYFRRNALQSLLVTAEISKRVIEQNALGNKAQVEYCLCGTLDHVEMYPERTLNILTNESSDHTHTFSVFGTDLRENFTFTEGEMTVALKDARLTLLKICSKLNAEGKPVSYLYDENNNSGTPDQFIANIQELASVGSDLYVNFITQKKRSFRDQLRLAIAKASSIQIAAVKSAKYVFPWALVYDKNFERSSKNRVCDLFLQGIKAAELLSEQSQMNRLSAMMETQHCLSVGCPYDKNPEIICPSGFWGYRHLIEQPPSIASEGDKDIPIRDTELLIKIKGNPTMVMGVSLNLDHPDAHREQLENLKQYRIAFKQSKKTIFEEMSKIQQPNIVYFYCHGGKDERKKPFLGVGDQQRIVANDLVNSEIKWTDSHPLIFINGCRTVELSPDDLLSFINLFMWCEASGVIGTEISLPESLAREFALRFFRMLESDSVGNAIRQTRLHLLAKYNLLGLAYTPYCHGALQFNVQTN